MFGYLLLAFILGVIAGAIACYLIYPKRIIEVETPVPTEVEKYVYVTPEEVVGSESFVPAEEKEAEKKSTTPKKTKKKTV